MGTVLNRAMIRAQGITKFYGARKALADVSFEIGSGEVVGFLGKNGAGKTTVLKILCGLLIPSAGSVTVDGIDGLEDARALRRKIGFLPDRPPLYPELTVRQMLAYAGRLHGVPADRIDARVTEVLKLASLESVADDLVEWLSHGYRQRVGIGTAIIHEPKLVVLDEPISGLDPAQIVAMRELIRGLKAKHTVLLSSHILSEISETCDRILVLHNGHVVAEGTEAALLGGGGNEVTVIARGAAQAARAALEKLEGLKDMSVSERDGLATVRTQVASDAAREALVAALVSAGLGVRSVTDARGGLEELFLKLTGDAAPSMPTHTSKGQGAA
jgi:ABC-2 type transport system ATP-binding protein